MRRACSYENPIAELGGKFCYNARDDFYGVRLELCPGNRLRLTRRLRAGQAPPLQHVTGHKFS
jgi:hypothetical protein